MFGKTMNSRMIVITHLNVLFMPRLLCKRSWNKDLSHKTLFIYLFW